VFAFSGRETQYEYESAEYVLNVRWPDVEEQVERSPTSQPFDGEWPQ
jgi:hypothetical protein